MDIKEQMEFMLKIRMSHFETKKIQGTNSASI